MLILICGVVGSGKSTFAHMLAKYSDGIVLHADILRKELFPQPTYSPAETHQCIEELHKRTLQFLLQKKTVLVDALFSKQKARDWYISLAKQYALPYRIVIIKSDESCIQKRILQRKNDVFGSDADLAIYNKTARNFEYSTAGVEYTLIKNNEDISVLEQQARDFAKSVYKLPNNKK